MEGSDVETSGTLSILELLRGLDLERDDSFPFNTFERLLGLWPRVVRPDCRSLAVEDCTDSVKRGGFERHRAAALYARLPLRERDAPRRRLRVTETELEACAHADVDVERDVEEWEDAREFLVADVWEALFVPRVVAFLLRAVLVGGG